MSDQRIQKILDQTNFLVEKQNELFKFVTDTYTDILNKLEEKAKKESDQAVISDLNSIKDNIAAHYKDLSEQITEDIDFLGEQLQAIVQVKEMEDKDKGEELLNMLVEKDENLIDTDEFKKQVEEDLIASTRELKAMHEDLLSSLEENKIQELKLMLEAVQEHEKDLDKAEGSESEGCEPADCSTCSGCAPSQNSDIFDFFKEEADKNDEKK